MKNLYRPLLTAICMVGIMYSHNARAQQFGQNKVRYTRMNFKVLQTPHFDIYYYLENKAAVDRIAKQAEAWYSMHSHLFKDKFDKHNPIILYANSPDFQQTTAIEGDIGVGTGGVTEALKNRVVFPIMDLNNQTRHVLGHELVHAFQYHTLLERDSIPLQNVGETPLWMVEGMAEYFSLGSHDAFTAMWMRDALLSRDIPSLKALTTTNKYFPYRYGQAFWAFIGAMYGDTTVVPLFKNTAKYGYENALKYTLGYDDKTLSGLWKNAIEKQYRPLLKADSSQVRIQGKRLLDNKNAGNINVAPAVSPNGNYVAFLSEKDLFGIDLFLADAHTGRVIRKLASKQMNNHIDDFNFIESAGTWSPDSKRFAFSIYSAGRNQILIINAENGSAVERILVPEIPQLNNLTWSPDGKSIAFTGLKNAQSDLYSIDLQTKAVKQLTNDVYSDYAPAYSPDGKYIVFSSDRKAYAEGSAKAADAINLALLDLQKGTVSNINVFTEANNLNPQFSGDGKSVYFLSNRDGFRNLYKYNLASGETRQLTDYFTGISGITEFSPALSVSRNDDVVYSYYRNSGYTIYNNKGQNFKSVPVANDAVSMQAAILPPPAEAGSSIVQNNLSRFKSFITTPTDSLKIIPYKPKFKLDYLANSGVGVATSRFGTGLQGGIIGTFSDILGYNQLIGNLSINGEVYDFAGMFGYINKKNRINWGAMVSHIPYLYGIPTAAYETIDINGQPVEVINDQLNIIRTFEESAQLFASYPFSKIHRFELGTGFTSYSHRVDRMNFYYDRATGYYIGSERKKISNDDFNSQTGYDLKRFHLYSVNAAFVGDNSIFGLTAPLDGFRYRLSAEANMGTYNFITYNIDLRKYWRVKPVTLAVRSYNIGRVGKDGDKLYQLYLGYPFLVRGYEANSIYYSKNGQSGLSYSDLSGTNVSVFNFEVRLPFTGPKKLAQIKSNFLITDLNAFFDAGVAWDRYSTISFSGTGNSANAVTPGTADNVRRPIYSAGLSLRVNVFGALILEPYYAFPFQRSDIKYGTFGLNFTPGW